MFKMAGKKRSISLGADLCTVQKEWDEALCPICMEQPHNAVLLLCSSHAKGCRSYICDTSYRHSNCLDRFRKLKTDSSNGSPAIPPANMGGSSDASAPQSTLLFGNELPQHPEVHNRNQRNISVEWSQDSGEYDLRQETIGRENLALGDRSELVAKSKLKCPLCRGDVLGWTVVEEARKHLNLKTRSCTRESCTFVGNYHELRRHARSIHPRTRPAEIDPSRQRAWRRIEHQREHDDIVSAIRSAMPGAIVLGDYVIEDSDRLPVERERTSGDASGPWWNTFFFFQMLESMQSLAGPRSRPRPWTRHRLSSGSSSRQRHLWGENLLGLQNEEDDDVDDSFTEEEEVNFFADVSQQNTSPVRRQRRRLTRSRSSRDHL